MEKYTIEQLEIWHASSNFKEDTLENATLLGCCYCCKTYTPSSITEYLVAQKWSGKGFIFCPHCEVDLVISDNGTGEIDPQLLVEMRNNYFVQPSDFEDRSKLPKHGKVSLANGQVVNRTNFKAIEASRKK